MITGYDEIVESALALPPSARAILAEQLFESLDDMEQKEVDTAWINEIEKRVADYKAGKIKAIPAEQVFSELKAKLRK